MLRGEPVWRRALDSNGVEQIGFYTTRYVMAKSAEEAVERAMTSVTEEVKHFAMNPPTSPVRIEVEECVRLNGLVTTPGRGFGFWDDTSREEALSVERLASRW